MTQQHEQENQMPQQTNQISDDQTMESQSVQTPQLPQPETEEERKKRETEAAQKKLNQLIDTLVEFGKNNLDAWSCKTHYYWFLAKNQDGDAGRCLLCSPEEDEVAKTQGYLKFNPNVVKIKPKSDILKKHFTRRHLSDKVFQRVDERVSKFLADPFAKGLTAAQKKRRILQSVSAVTKFFTPAGRRDKRYAKDDPFQKQHETYVAMQVFHNFQSINSVTSAYQRAAYLHLDCRIRPVNRKALTNEILPKMLSENIRVHVRPLLKEAVSINIAFDLWMSRSTDDIFSIIAHFIDSEWKPRRVALGLLNSEKGDGASLAQDVKTLLEPYPEVKNRLLSVCKDGGANLTTCTEALVRPEFELESDLNRFLRCGIIQADCYAHAINTSVKHGMNNCGDTSKMFKDMRAKLQACCTLINKSTVYAPIFRELQQANSLPIRKIKTPVKTRFCSYLQFVKGCLENQQPLDALYRRKVERKYRSRLIDDHTWHVAMAFNDAFQPALGLIQKLQTEMSEEWLISDAIVRVMQFYLSCREFSPSDQQKEFWEDVSVDGIDIIETIRAEMALTLKPFLNPLLMFEGNKCHMYLALCLDPRTGPGAFRCLHPTPASWKCVCQQYDTQSLVPALSSIYLAAQGIVDNSSVESSGNLDNDPSSFDFSFLLDQNSHNQWNNDERTRAAINDEKYQYFKLVRKLRRSLSEEQLSSLNVLKWWSENELSLPLLSKLAKHIFGIPATEIGCERMFSVSGLLTALRRNRLGTKTLNTIACLNYNYAKDPLHVIQKDTQPNEEYSDSELEDNADDELDVSLLDINSDDDMCDILRRNA